jgi:plasmid stabilization system protein ParE
VKYSLRLRPEAAADIDEAAAWYEARSPGAAAGFLGAVRQTLKAVEETPNRFPLVRGSIRRAKLRRFPYAFFYYLDGDVVVGIACMHFRRDPRRWFARRP